ncbi:MAG: MarR family transcriptional regulator [Alphaproteobacteria bacterium]|nr:MarR family transcriptional regulator [Alphaproteobacteria bacterium]
MLRLNSYLPYLVNRVGQRLVAGFTPALRAQGMDVQMWRVMIVLHAEGPQSAGALSRLTSINLSTLSRLVARMEEKRLVARRRDGADARSVVVAPTEEGRRRTEALLPAAAALEAAADFTEAELATLKSLLAKLYAGTADAQPSGEEDRREAS